MQYRLICKQPDSEWVVFIGNYDQTMQAVTNRTIVYTELRNCGMIDQTQFLTFMDSLRIKLNL